MPGFRERRSRSWSTRGPEPRGRAQIELVERLRRVQADAAGSPSSCGTVPPCGVRWRGSPRGASSVWNRSATCAPPRDCPSERPRPSFRRRHQERVLGPVLEAVGAGGFAPFLLHGITGSGKTEVYFRAAERGARARDAERSCSCRKSPSLPCWYGPPPRASGTRSPCSTASCRRGSGTTSGGASARATLGWSWARARRSSHPVPELGLVVVDEEHETAYKQEDSPRYHARDAAVMRARLEGVPVILGSATPSVESETNARNGKYRALAMPGRIGTAGPAAGRDRGPPGGAPRRRRPDPEPASARCAGSAPGKARAVATAIEPPGLRHLPPLPRVRCPGRLPELLGLPHRPRGGEAGALPLLRTRRGRAGEVPFLPGRVPAAHGLRNRAGGGSGARGLSEGTRRSSRSRPGLAPGRPGTHPGRVRGGGDGRPGGHADDRQGPRLPAGHARRSGGRRRGPGAARLPLRGAHVPAPHPGGGAGGPGRRGGRGDPSEPPARPLRDRRGVRPGLHGLLRARDGVPADDGLSAGGRARQPDRALAGAGGGGAGGGGAGDGPAGPCGPGAIASSGPRMRRSRACGRSIASRSCSRARARRCEKRCAARS